MVPKGMSSRERRLALFLDLVGAQSPPRDVGVEGVLNGIRLAQHDGVLYRYAPLTHLRWAGVHSVADQQHAPRVSAVHVHPLDPIIVELRIALKGGEILQDRSTQLCKPVPDPFEAARERVLLHLEMSHRC